MNRTRLFNALVALALTVTLLGTVQPARAEGAVTDDDLRAILPYLTGRTALVVAKHLGVTSIGGKKLYYPPTAGVDGYIRAEDLYQEMDPSIAVNPANEMIVAAAHEVSSGTGCQAEASFDGGNTFNWAVPVYLPLINPANDICATPVVRFSPDGTTVYYLYVELNNVGLLVSDVMLATASGKTPLVIGPPAVVMSGSMIPPGWLITDPWIDTVILDTTGGEKGTVYISATGYQGVPGPVHGIFFNSSVNYGANWLMPVPGPMPGIPVSPLVPPAVQLFAGSRPIGNPYSLGWVDVCWYDSGTDGIRTGTFNIQCWANDGRGSGPTTVNFLAVSNAYYELDQYLGPSGYGNEWWSGMWPRMAVDDSGMIYIAYTVDPTSVFTDSKAGLVMLARGWPDGVTYPWAAPVKVTKGQAQGLPTASARCDRTSGKCYVYIAYYQHTNYGSLLNALYNVWYIRASSVPPASPPTTVIPKLSLGKAVRISDVNSITSHGYKFTGNYMDSFVTSRRYMVAWTDRSDATSNIDLDTDVMYDYFIP